ncbi:HK97 family phage prohead protease [Aminobacter aminovorans]|uniref:Phage prohead protease, HK97 family n=1 Tax=Aminobacter aminovorans TaxID=83263 RepID=A0A380WMM9_AMIAI|nr:HK97 family phage prohead protease [Aminobacter aminovorans]TCS27592.1 HK97 family phage prohead protease [Aminobacter aminovorans]SUU89995.1 phage prohead protease, HK97 family [Aminobacter aminovorans]
MRLERRSASDGIEYSATGFIERPAAARPAPFTKSVVADGDELVGTACVYGVPHYGKNRQREVFVPGCFARSLASQQAIRLLLDHDESKLIATRADSLRIESDDLRLTIRCKVAGTSAGAVMKAAVNEGGRMECSVGYNVVESYERLIESESVKFITDARLLEISLVRKGAVPGTSASIRYASDSSLLKAFQGLEDALDARSRAFRQLLDSL